MQAGVAVVEGDAAVESLIDVNSSSGKAEALAFPFHDVVVADHALRNEAADAVEISCAGGQAVWVSRGRRAKRRL